MNKRAEETPAADSASVEIANNEVFDKPIENEETIIQPKENISFEVNKYFTEDSENVFDLSFQLCTFFDKNKREDFDYKTESIALVISMIFSTFLIISSVIGTVRLFINKLKHTSWFYILNISFILLIVISNMFVWLDRIGQIKFGFYLLLFSNFYMLYVLKKQKEQTHN